eukprot:30937-Pelagococcus_subviridis.AAC.50
MRHNGFARGHAPRARARVRVVRGRLEEALRLRRQGARVARRRRRPGRHARRPGREHGGSRRAAAEALLGRGGGHPEDVHAHRVGRRRVVVVLLLLVVIRRRRRRAVHADDAEDARGGARGVRARQSQREARRADQPRRARARRASERLEARDARRRLRVPAVLVLPRARPRGAHGVHDERARAARREARGDLEEGADARGGDGKRTIERDRRVLYTGSRTTPFAW